MFFKHSGPICEALCILRFKCFGVCDEHDLFVAQIMHGGVHHSELLELLKPWIMRAKTVILFCLCLCSNLHLLS